jgi:hypothetical protein
MNYENIYNTIIERSKNRTLSEYTEEHHIVPRCLGGTDDSSNLVDLTAEEHYVCHQLLVKMYPNNIRLVNAAMFMVANGMNRRSNKSYGWLRRRWSEYMKGPNNPGKNQPKGKEHWKFGVPFDTSCFTEEGWKSMSESKLGDKNPMAGIKPWKHGRATDITKAIWARADEIYEIWLTNDKPSFCKLFGLCMNKKYDWKRDGKEVGPFMNLVKYFRNGWVPAEDLEWKKLKETI